jgi:hypothetical protein
MAAHYWPHRGDKALRIIKRCSTALRRAATGNRSGGGTARPSMLYSPAHGDTAFTVPLFDALSDAA